jgi:hypothetical protein
MNDLDRAEHRHTIYGGGAGMNRWSWQEPLTTRTRRLTGGVSCPAETRSLARLVEPLFETGVHWPCGFSGWIPASPDAESG